MTFKGGLCAAAAATAFLTGASSALAASVTLSAPTPNGTYLGPGSYGTGVDYIADRELSGCSVGQNSNVFRIAYKRLTEADGRPAVDDFKPIAQTVENHLQTNFLTGFGTWQAKAYFPCTANGDGSVNFIESDVVTFTVKNTLDPDGDGVQGTNDHCPTSPGDTLGCPGGVRPDVTGVKLKPKRVKPSKGATFTWFQSDQGSMKISFVFSPKGPGHAARTVAKLVQPALPGENELAFNGVVNGEQLPAGKYEAVFKAIDEEGLKSKTDSVKFTLAD